MKTEERAVAPLAGGIMQQGYQCGMLWGAALAAGAQAYRLHGPGPQAEAEAILAAKRLVDSFRSRNKEINCFEITELNWKGGNQALPILKFIVTGGPIGCFRMAASYAPVAFSDIHAEYSEKHGDAPPAPVSCAAVLAQKMGASDLHTVMAAGLAGGIGLSGGGCGALGAAIWLAGMNDGPDGLKNLGFENPKAVEAMDRYLKSADYRFECAEIVGRKFESVADHAAYLRQGGCAGIIDALATS